MGMVKKRLSGGWITCYINKENKDSNMSLDGLCRGLGFYIGDWIMKGQNFECHKWS